MPLIDPENDFCFRSSREVTNSTTSDVDSYDHFIKVRLDMITTYGISKPLQGYQALWTGDLRSSEMSDPTAGFTSASAVLKSMPPPVSDPSTTAVSNNDSAGTGPPTAATSHRNASNAHLPAEPFPAETESSEAGPSKPVNKPVNVPAGNKRSIIVNACQVGVRWAQTRLGKGFLRRTITFP